MAIAHTSTQFVPEILNNPAWEDKIHVRQFSHSKLYTISVIQFDQSIWDTIVATNKANLHPFKSYRRTPSGNIEFTTVDVTSFSSRAIENIPASPRNSGINPRAMATVHGFRDVRSAQANDRDEPTEY